MVHLTSLMRTYIYVVDVFFLPFSTQVFDLMQRDNFERFRQNPRSMEDFVSCVFREVDRSNNGTISLEE